jgi:hypothetical protein
VDMCELFPATASNFYMRLHTRLAEKLSTVTFQKRRRDLWTDLLPN